MNAPARSIPSPWWVLAAVSVGTFMATLDASSVNVALPTIAREFGVDIATVSWISLVYFLVITALLLTVGRLSDLSHRGRMYAVGMGLFGMASGLCAIAPNFGALVAMRGLEAVGGALVMANSPALVASLFPKHERGRALGTVTLVATVGSSVGPSLGGIIVAHGGWHLLFALNLPIGIAGALHGWRMLAGLDQQAPATRRFDTGGAIFSAVGLGASVFALREAPRHGLTVILAAGAIGLIGLAAFLLWEARHPAPLVRLGMFRRPAFASATGSSFLSFCARAGAFFLLPFFLEHVQGYTPDRVGFMMTGFPLAMALVAPVSGALSDKLGTRGLTMGGQALSAMALALMALMPTAAPFWAPVSVQALLGVGAALFTPPNNSAMLGAVEAEELGMASGLLAVMRNSGLVAGTGLVTGILAGHAGDFLGGFRAALGVAAAIALLAALAASVRPSPRRVTMGGTP